MVVWELFVFFIPPSGWRYGNDDGPDITKANKNIYQYANDYSSHDFAKPQITIFFSTKTKTKFFYFDGDWWKRCIDWFGLFIATLYFYSKLAWN